MWNEGGTDISLVAEIFRTEGPFFGGTFSRDSSSCVEVVCGIGRSREAPHTPWTLIRYLHYRTHVFVRCNAIYMNGRSNRELCRSQCVVNVTSCYIVHYCPSIFTRDCSLIFRWMAAMHYGNTRQQWE